MGLGFGELPPEYNARVHGVYDPARFYGKPDTAFGEVKIGELGAWLGRRNKTPVAVGRAISRSWWRWNHRYIFPLKANGAGYFQLVTGTMLFFYVINYGKLTRHRFFKYHW